MAKLNKDEIFHIAKLAKLSLSDSEIKKFLPQLTNVVEYIGHLKEVDVKNIEPTAQVTGLENVYRNDETDFSSILSNEEALGGTDKTYNGYFKVGAILEGRTDK